MGRFGAPQRQIDGVLELVRHAQRAGPAPRSRAESSRARASRLPRRQAAILRQDVHLLELDLLLQGERMPYL